MEKNGNSITITEEESKICLINNKKFESSRKMIWYVRKTYKLSFEEYIVKYYYNGIYPTCSVTGKKLSFKSHKLGPWFSNYSSNSFPRKEHTNESKDKIREGIKKSSLEKYGVDNVFKADWCKEKIKKTNLEKYGVENPMQNKSISSKIDYNKSYETIEKTKKTNLERYGKETVWGSNHFVKIYKENFIKNHGEIHPMHVKEFREKCALGVRKTMIEKFKSLKYINRTNTKPERDFKSFLESINEPYRHQFQTKHGIIDFYLPRLKLFIEIDGEFWHQQFKCDLNFIQLYNSIRDFNKNKNLKNLVRIRSSELINLKTINDIFKYSYDQQTNIPLHQKILNKEYFSWVKENKNVNYLKTKINTLYKFIQTYSPQLPKYESSENDLNKIITYIKNYNYSKFYMDMDYDHKSIPNCGNGYLKTIFNSYWKSNYNRNLSPYDAWQDEKIMKEVIAYRIGINNSGEVYDFSLKEIIKGLSARRITISFFKPTLAAAIYRKYCGNKINPVVFDPCCGFGGRLLGFKSVYPQGTYIGCEPNIETYNELLQLRNNLGYDESTVKIYNCKIEDFHEEVISDFSFTSIPYYDLEVYSNNVEYSSFQEWETTFIDAITKKTKNCYINCDLNTSQKLGWDNIVSKLYIGNSHFTKSKEKKYEVIVKIN